MAHLHKPEPWWPQRSSGPGVSPELGAHVRPQPEPWRRRPAPRPRPPAPSRRGGRSTCSRTSGAGGGGRTDPGTTPRRRSAARPRRLRTGRVWAPRPTSRSCLPGRSRPEPRWGCTRRRGKLGGEWRSSRRWWWGRPAAPGGRTPPAASARGSSRRAGRWTPPPAGKPGKLPGGEPQPAGSTRWGAPRPPAPPGTPTSRSWLRGSTCSRCRAELLLTRVSLLLCLAESLPPGPESPAARRATGNKQGQPSQ